MVNGTWTLCLGAGTILFLVLFLRYMPGVKEYCRRILLPVIAMLGAGVIGAVLEQVQLDLGVLLIVLAPAMAVLTIWPFVRPGPAEETERTLIVILCIVLTLGYLSCRWGCNFGGTASVFLPLWYAAPPAISAFLQVRVLCIYAELCILCGTAAGIIVPAFPRIRDLPAEKTPAAVSGTSVIALVFGIASVWFTTLAPGLLAVFLCLLVREIRSRTAGILMLASGAVLLTALLSVMPAGVYSFRPVEPCDFSLCALLLLALGALTLFPLAEPFLAPRGLPLLYAGTTVAVVGTALLFHDPALPLPAILASGLSAITGSGVFAAGIPFPQGMAEKLAVYAATVIIAGTAYAIAVLAMTWRKRTGTTNP